MALDILIVDDERDIRDLVAGVLGDEGYDCRTAADSTSALAAIDERRPSLVLLRRPTGRELGRRTGISRWRAARVNANRAGHGPFTVIETKRRGEKHGVGEESVPVSGYLARGVDVVELGARSAVAHEGVGWPTSG